jgi:sec-independent protein translocase protein TatA
MLGQLRGWEWLIIVALVLLLFGAKRLPDTARGLGRSLRIFKAETKGLVDDGAGGDGLAAGSKSGANSVDGVGDQSVPRPVSLERTDL